jgi:hypothetical protein
VAANIGATVVVPTGSVASVGGRVGEESCCELAVRVFVLSTHRHRRLDKASVPERAGAHSEQDLGLVGRPSHRAAADRRGNPQLFRAAPDQEVRTRRWHQDLDTDTAPHHGSSTIAPGADKSAAAPAQTTKAGKQ